MYCKSILFLSLFVLFFFTGCANKNIAYQTMPVDNVVEKAQQKELFFWVETEFSIHSTSRGVSQKKGYWHLMSNNGTNSRLTVAINPSLVKQLKDEYQVDNLASLEGRLIKIKGMVEPYTVCIVAKGCKIKGAKGERPFAVTVGYIEAESIERLTII
ncbi:hypothetical protein [Thalassotalea sp. PP2-459]|uniref:hypothetical protein n=1 Tax=Thalassotalea sp. PP2-459 TaxID=1742724 RepID=UPI000941E1A0|nr:hypothetical protein [Thalassotalea sp. PP2-459]OKY26992.1 hypothetical protein BI291_10770 [Thalassotalea sp. PP2-459]